MNNRKIVIIGPAYPLRGGGITTFNERLCTQFNSEGFHCVIYSFSLQYPAFLFPGTTQISTELPPANISILPRINSINPANWITVGNELKNVKPHIVVVRYWLPFMAPALGTILRRLRKNKSTKIIAITDNIIPHERRAGDKLLTRYFLNSCDAFITMSEQVMNDLRQFKISKPVRHVAHPLYDNFGPIIPKEQAREHLSLPQDAGIVLFFGFIRKYKGLDLLLESMKMIKDRSGTIGGKKIKLLIAGEFYDNDKDYKDQIRNLQQDEMVILRTHYIADNDVKHYLSAADVVVQPYRHATQSGVTPLAYHFEKPMIVTNVGGLPAMVPPQVGIVCEPEPASIAEAIERFFQLGENYFIPHLRNEKKKYSWSHLVSAITQLAESVQKPI